MPSMTQRGAFVAEVARLLNAAGITQYRLRTEAGVSARTSRILLSLEPGTPTVDSIEAALALVGREPWHRPARKR